MQVCGPNGEVFTEADIEVSSKRDVMRSMVLHNELGEVVVVVNHPTKKHFRVLGSAFGEKPAGERKDGTHDACVAYIHEQLTSRPGGFRVVSLVLTCKTAIYRKTGRPGPSKGEKWGRDKQTIVQPATDATYQWFRGSPARARFKDQFYIEPDLCGRPEGSFQPTGRNLGIVVEVIRQHPPDPPTFERLFQLSKSAHMVIFYLILEGEVDSNFNRMWVADGVSELTVSFYIMNGKFYETGVHIPPTGKTVEQRYAQYVKGVLTDALNDVKKAQQSS